VNTELKEKARQSALWDKEAEGSVRRESKKLPDGKSRGTARKEQEAARQRHAASSDLALYPINTFLGWFEVCLSCYENV